MADEMRIGLDELLRKARVKGDAGFLRGRSDPLPGTDGEMEVEQHVGAARYERSPSAATIATATGLETGTRGSGPWS